MTPRVVAGRPGRITVGLYDTVGQPVTPDAGTATVTVTGLVGGLLVDAAAATGTSAGQVWLDLNGTEVVDVDRLDVACAYQVSGVAATASSTVDAVGTTLVPLGSLVAAVGSTVPATALPEVVARTENRIAAATGWQWVDRLVVATLPPTGGRQVTRAIDGASPLGQVVTALDADGDPVDVDVAAADLALVRYRSTGTVTVTVRTRPVETPPDLQQAAVAGARHLALVGTTSGRDRRAAANLGDGDGVRAFPFQTASLKHGRPFGVDGIDTDVMAHDRRVAVA